MTIGEKGPGESASHVTEADNRDGMRTLFMCLTLIAHGASPPHLDLNLGRLNFNRDFLFTLRFQFAL
jgi:hypothetical protein